MREWSVRSIIWIATAAWLFGSGSRAWAGLPWAIDGSWRVERSNLRYEVRHPMHDCDGSSQAASGLITCKESGKDSTCDFQIEVEVATFVSRNSDKDRDMRKVLRAAEFSQVVIAGKALVQGSKVILQPVLTLAGQSRPLSTAEFKLEKSWRKARLQGQLLWKIGDFGLQRPTLLGIPVADEVLTHIDVELRKN
jgi:hypothetical protein